METKGQGNGRESKKLTKKQIEQMEKENNEYVFLKNNLLMEQMKRYARKCYGNLKFNEDSYLRKRGRMKPINPQYEWELDAENIEMEESRLKAVYEDTKENLSLEIKKTEQTLNRVGEQQERIIEKYPEFKDFEIKAENLTNEEIDKAMDIINERKVVWALTK